MNQLFAWHRLFRRPTDRRQGENTPEEHTEEAAPLGGAAAHRVRTVNELQALSRPHRPQPADWTSWATPPGAPIR
ncbi:hypothetical protein [Streptomyces sp. NBC_01565]|uniref:DUF6245 family protein n=1 Tax=unclassified Streptomyces TaxID=2593676 RepID=UPI002255FF0A|nr:hypothetical protein [Streptomyces sp. NBC_01565]MCX4547022.1 hypothetical protein [Streptomyces sp. NBC_01565]